MRPILQLLVVLLGLVVVPLAGMLLAVAATWEGRSIALGLGCALGAMGVAVWGRTASRGRRGIAVALSGVSLGLAGAGGSHGGLGGVGAGAAYWGGRKRAAGVGVGAADAGGGSMMDSAVDHGRFLSRIAT